MLSNPTYAQMEFGCNDIRDQTRGTKVRAKEFTDVVADSNSCFARLTLDFEPQNATFNKGIKLQVKWSESLSIFTSPNCPNNEYEISAGGKSSFTTPQVIELLNSPNKNVYIGIKCETMNNWFQLNTLKLPCTPTIRDTDLGIPLIDVYPNPTNH